MNITACALNCDGSQPLFKAGNILTHATEEYTYYKVLIVLPARPSQNGNCQGKAEYMVQKCSQASITEWNGDSIDGDEVLRYSCRVESTRYKMSEDQFKSQCSTSLEWKEIYSEPEYDPFYGTFLGYSKPKERINRGIPNSPPNCAGTIQETEVCCTPPSKIKETKAALQACTSDGYAMKLDQTNFFVNTLADCYWGVDSLYRPKTFMWTLLDTWTDRALTEPETKCVCAKVPQEMTELIQNQFGNANTLVYKHLQQPDSFDLSIYGQHDIFSITNLKTVALCLQSNCDPGQFRQCSTCDNYRCQSRCALCPQTKWSYGNEIACFNHLDCPANSNPSLLVTTTRRNTMCRCTDNMYVKEITNDERFTKKALELESDGSFESHLGQCTQCKSISECDNTTEYLDGCVNGEDHECVCKAGYYSVKGNCQACQDFEYKIADKKGVQEECTKCIDSGQKTRPGAATQADCYCGESLFFEQDSRRCVPCRDLFPKKPYRAQFDPPNCTECHSRSKFNFEEGCQRWEDIGMVMTIQCINPTWRINPPYDQFIRDSTDYIPETLNPAHDLWKRAYANVNAKTWKITDLFKGCSNCRPGQYRIACGGPVRLNATFRSETYQIALKINGTRVLKTLDAQFESSEDYDQICPGDDKSPHVEILREGKCENCKTCDSGNYVDGCEKNNAGTCKVCDVCDVEDTTLETAKEYLYHPKIDQCVGPTTQDCERRKCDKSKKQEINGLPTKYKIGIECGLHDVDIWDPTTPRLENVEIKTRTIKGTGRYQKGKLEKYCPTGYYVDPDCFKENEDWNRQCCILCKLHDALQKRSSDYRECPGDEDTDTQTYVERCENGFYETTVSDTETTSICKPCSTCSFS